MNPSRQVLMAAKENGFLHCRSELREDTDPPPTQLIVSSHTLGLLSLVQDVFFKEN
jgi:hypothetical protein